MHNENSKITSLSGCVLNNYYMYIICETSVSAYSVDCETSSCHLTLHYFIIFSHGTWLPQSSAWSCHKISSVFILLSGGDSRTK